MTLMAHQVALGYHKQALIPPTSLTIEKGQMTCIIGPNGCGKSTLLRALGGLLTPMSGRITLDDKALEQWPKKRLARRLSLLPQHPIAPEGISVKQLVSHGRYPHQGLLAQNSHKDIEIIEWALEATEMLELQDRTFSSLSGGEKQRGWIALALAQQSDILLLDEPTTYLDIGHQLDILDLLSSLHRQHHLTIVMVLHDINQASQYSDRVIALKDGNIIADGLPLDIISESLIENLFGIRSELIHRYYDGKKFLYSLPISNMHIVTDNVQTEKEKTTDEELKNLTLQHTIATRQKRN